MCRWLFFLCVSLGLTLAPLTSKSWGQNCFGVAVDPPSGAAISTTQQFNISFVLHGVEPPFQWNLGAPLIYAGISQSKGVQLRSSTGNIYLPSSLTKTSDYWFLVKFQNLPTATDFGLIIHNIITSKQRFNLGPIGWANYTTNPDPLPSSPGPTELEDCPVPSRDPWWIGLPPEPSFTLSPSIVLEETLWTLRLEFNFSSDSPFSWNLSSFIYHNEIYELQSPLQGTLRAASIEQSIPLVRTGVYQPAHEGVNMDGAYFDMYQVTSRDEIQAILDGTLNPFFLDTFEVSLNTGSTWSAYSNSSSATEMLLRAEGLESLSNYTARFGSPAIYIQWLSGQWSIGYDTVFSCPKGSPRNLMCPHCPIVYHALEYFSSVPALRVVTPLLFEAAGFDFGNASVTKEMFFSLNGTSYDNAELIVTPEFEARFIFDLDDAVFHERQLLYPVTNFTGFFVEGATLRNMLFVPKTYFGHSLNHIGVAPWTWLAQASCDEAQGSGLGFQISSLYHGGSAYRAEVLRHFDSLKANASMDRIALNDSVLRLRYSQVPLRAEIHLRQPLIKQAILEAQPGIVVVEDARTARIQWRIINVGEVGTIPNFLVVCDEGLVAEPLTIGGLLLPGEDATLSLTVRPGGGEGNLTCKATAWPTARELDTRTNTSSAWSLEVWGDSLFPSALFGLAVTNVTLAGQQLLIAGHVNNSGSTTSGTADLHCNGTISASAALSLPLGSTAISFSVPTAGLTGTLLCTVRVWMASQQASDALVTTFTASVPPPDPDCSPQPLLFFTLPVWSSGPSAHAISSAFNISSTVFWVLSTPQLHLSGFLVNAGDPDAEILLNISCATIPTYLEHYSTPGRSAVAFSAAFSLNPSLYGTSISCHIGASIPHPHTCWTLGTAVTTTFDAPLQSPDFFFQMPLSFWLASLPTVPTIFSAAENPFHLQVLSTSSSLSFNGYVHNRGTVAAPYSLELVCEPPAQVLSFSKSTLAPPGAHSSFSFSVSLTTTNSSCQLALLSAPSSGLAPFGKNLTQQFSLLAASPWNVSLLQPPTSHPGSYQRTFVQSNVTLEIQNQLLIPTPLRSFCDCGEMPFQCDLSTLPLSLEPNQRLPVSFVVKAPLSSSGSHLCTLNLARDDATSHPLSVPFIPSFGCGEDFIEPFLGQPRIWWSSHSDDFAVSCTFNTTVSNLFQTVVVCPVANFGLDLVAVNATFMCDSPAAAVLTGPLVRLIPSFSIESFVFGVETSQSMALHSLSCSFTVNVTDTHPCWSPSGKAARSSLELTLPCGNVSEALLAFPLATWKSLGTGHIFDSTDNPLALQITPRKGSTWVDFSFFVQNYGSGFANGFLNITCPNGTTGTALTIAPQSVQRVTLALVMVQSAECLAVASVSSGPCDSPFGKLLSQRFNFTLTSTIDSSGALPQAVLPIVISASAGVFAVFLAFGGFATARYFLTKRRFARTRGFLHATLMVDRDPE